MSKIIRVASQSSPALVAGAIAGVYREKEVVNVQAMGASAVNQAVKALIRAKEYLAEENKFIVFEPDFVDIDINGQSRTAIRFHVTPMMPSVSSELVEVMPVDTGNREDSGYLLNEETAMDYTAVSADADAIEERIGRYTDDEAIQEDFAERQKQASSGREQLIDKLENHEAESPTLSGGDIDARWDQSGVGDETVGGMAPTPDQDRVDELGEALGITYEDDEPLDPDKVAKRDEERWELDPASAETE